MHVHYGIKHRDTVQEYGGGYKDLGEEHGAMYSTTKQWDLGRFYDRDPRPNYR